MGNFSLETIVDDDAVAAKVTVKWQGYEASYTGSAKRHPRDMADAVTGEALAVSRALARAAEDLQKLADDRVDRAATGSVDFDYMVMPFGYGAKF